MRTLQKVMTVLAALLAMALAWPAAAQVFPTRPVRMVVPFPPGAASDFLARVLGQKLGDVWGQQVVVDNRPGAGGLIGGTLVARASPDGHTIPLIGQPHLTATLLSRDPPWNPFEDFTHIGLVATMPNVVVVGPGLPVNFVSELIAQVYADSVRLLKTDDLRNRFQQQGAEATASTPEEFEKIQHSEYQRVRKILRDIGLKPQ